MKLMDSCSTKGALYASMVLSWVAAKQSPLTRFVTLPASHAGHHFPLSCPPTYMSKCHSRTKVTWTTRAMRAPPRCHPLAPQCMTRRPPASKQDAFIINDWVQALQASPTPAANLHVFYFKVRWDDCLLSLMTAYDLQMLVDCMLRLYNTPAAHPSPSLHPRSTPSPCPTHGLVAYLKLSPCILAVHDNRADLGAWGHHRAILLLAASAHGNHSTHIGLVPFRGQHKPSCRCALSFGAADQHTVPKWREARYLVV